MDQNLHIGLTLLDFEDLKILVIETVNNLLEN